LVGLAFPSVADAQRRGGGGGGTARGTAVRTGGAVVRGGGVHRGTQVAVPRTHAPYSYYRPYYSRPYYSRPYYYRSYYSGYYPHYYSPWSFSLSFGFGYGGYYAPFYAYPYYPSPYVSAYPAYSYPNSPAQPDPSQRTYRVEERPTTAGTDDRGEFGTLSIRVMPADATILIDQQAWDRPRGDDRFSIELVEGPHHVEIRKAGYTTYVRTVDVPRGRSVVVNVALAPGGTGTMQVARTVPIRH
jgi:hypothetical protein